MFRIFIVSIALATFHSSAQEEVLIEDFENTESWTLDDFGSGFNQTYKTSGNHSMSVWNWYNHVSGFAINGEADLTDFDNRDPFDMPIGTGGTPFNLKPESISGKYLYDTTAEKTSINDSAVVYVKLRKYNVLTKTHYTVAIGRANLPGTDMAGGFQPLDIKLNYVRPDLEPDSIQIILISSINGRCTPEPEGLYFYVDDLVANMPSTAQVTILEKKEIEVWPNPIINEFNVTVADPERAFLSVYDSAGKMHVSKKLKTKNKFDFSFLQSGFYTAVVCNGNTSEKFKIIKP